MARKNKQPKAKNIPNPGKHPKQHEIPENKKFPKRIASLTSNNEFPTWKVSLLEFVDPYGWHQISREKFQEVIGKLKHFEGMTWNEILIRDKKKNHSIQLNQLDRAALERLEELKQDDVDDVISLRVSGEERIWGIRDGGSSLKLLWWDPNHQICPSKKKHT